MKLTEKAFTLLLLIFVLCELLCFSSAKSLPDEMKSIQQEGRNLSRRLLITQNSLFSVEVNKLKGGRMVEPEKAVKNSLRPRPPSSSNPTQNK